VLLYSGLLAEALILAGWAQIAVGLRPRGEIGRRVAAVCAGGAKRLGADVPVELAPLTSELGALLDAREADVARARQRAGDLAHGLKTPLQALLGEAERLRAAGRAPAAESIEAIGGTLTLANADPGLEVRMELPRAR
jgi:signal transduction histidine kinase